MPSVAPHPSISNLMATQVQHRVDLADNRRLGDPTGVTNLLMLGETGSNTVNTVSRSRGDISGATPSSSSQLSGWYNPWCQANHISMPRGPFDRYGRPGGFIRRLVAANRGAELPQLKDSLDQVVRFIHADVTAAKANEFAGGIGKGVRRQCLLPTNNLFFFDSSVGDTTPTAASLRVIQPPPAYPPRPTPLAHYSAARSEPTLGADGNMFVEENLTLAVLLSRVVTMRTTLALIGEGVAYDDSEAFVGAQLQVPCPSLAVSPAHRAHVSKALIAYHAIAMDANAQENTRMAGLEGGIVGVEGLLRRGVDVCSLSYPLIASPPSGELLTDRQILMMCAVLPTNYDVTAMKHLPCFPEPRSVIDGIASTLQTNLSYANLTPAEIYQRVGPQGSGEEVMPALMAISKLLLRDYRRLRGLWTIHALCFDFGCRHVVQDLYLPMPRSPHPLLAIIQTEVEHNLADIVSRAPSGSTVKYIPLTTNSAGETSYTVITDTLLNDDGTYQNRKRWDEKMAAPVAPRYLNPCRFSPTQTSPRVNQTSVHPSPSVSSLTTPLGQFGFTSSTVRKGSMGGAFPVLSGSQNGERVSTIPPTNEASLSVTPQVLSGVVAAPVEQHADPAAARPIIARVGQQQTGTLTTSNMDGAKESQPVPPALSHPSHFNGDQVAMYNLLATGALTVSEALEVLQAGLRNRLMKDSQRSDVPTESGPSTCFQEFPHKVPLVVAPPPSAPCVQSGLLNGGLESSVVPSQAQSNKQVPPAASIEPSFPALALGAKCLELRTTSPTTTTTMVPQPPSPAHATGAKSLPPPPTPKEETEISVAASEDPRRAKLDDLLAGLRAIRGSGPSSAPPARREEFLTASQSCNTSRFKPAGSHPPIKLTASEKSEILRPPSTSFEEGIPANSVSYTTPPPLPSHVAETTATSPVPSTTTSAASLLPSSPAVHHNYTTHPAQPFAQSRPSAPPPQPTPPTPSTSAPQTSMPPSPQWKVSNPPSPTLGKKVVTNKLVTTTDALIAAIKGPPPPPSSSSSSLTLSDDDDSDDDVGRRSAPTTVVSQMDRLLAEAAAAGPPVRSGGLDKGLLECMMIHARPREASVGATPQHVSVAPPLRNTE